MTNMNNSPLLTKGNDTIRHQRFRFFSRGILMSLWAFLLVNATIRIVRRDSTSFSVAVLDIGTTQKQHMDNQYNNEQQQRRQLQEKEKEKETHKDASSSSSSNSKLRLLYIVTSMNEFDTGKRNTIKGYDRFQYTLLPALQDSITSIIQSDYFEIVDIWLISHYPLSSTRKQQVSDCLPSSKIISVHFWDDATPFGYATEHSKTHTMDITRALARQHRYVIKDQLFEYDVFVNFEDDMIIHGEQIKQYLDLSEQLYDLRQTAADTTTSSSPNYNKEKALTTFYGPMTKSMLERMIPGFMRVEAALPGFTSKGENQYDMIPETPTFTSTRSVLTTNQQQQEERPRVIRPNVSLDASICCHTLQQYSSRNATTNDDGNSKHNDTTTTKEEHIIAHLPPTPPKSNDLYFWETSIDALGVRLLPHDDLGWALLQAGNDERLNHNPDAVIGDYWSGNDYYFPKLGGNEGNQRRPPRTKGRYVNNQGGWMATQRQLLEWDTTLCKGGFLPPFPAGSTHANDGLGLQGVEYWSGGIQIFGPASCNLQRILLLNPDVFSKQLLYHSANNKQRSPNVQHKFSAKSINTFWAQFNTITKNAERKINKATRNV